MWERPTEATEFIISVFYYVRIILFQPTFPTQVDRFSHSALDPVTYRDKVLNV